MRSASVAVRRLTVAAAVLAAFGACAPSRLPTPPVPRLVGYAMLPADTFAAGPTSGAYLGAAAVHGVAVPFVQKQPVMGFSALVALHDGRFLAATDNGYGTVERSSDFELRVYTLTPSFAAAHGGAGAVRVDGFVTLRDPNHFVPFAIVNHFTKERNLTGADFDIESMQRAPDGTLWFGDELGPYVLHTRATGELIAPPIPLPMFDTRGLPIAGSELWSPEHPSGARGVVRLLNAFRARGARFGGVAPPIVSPPAAAVGARFDVPSLTTAGYAVVPYTVNDEAEMEALLRQGVSGILSDRPDLLRDVAARNGPAGARLDRQGHRGARGLRPENTLPAMEAALDASVTTLETDLGITRDGVAVLDHEPYVQAATCRRRDGAPYAAPSEIGLRDILFSDLQASFLCDKIVREPPQSADLAGSPVAVAFARSGAIPAPYAMPSAAQLFAFVDFYRRYYAHGAGAGHPDAEARARTAAAVRFSLELKVGAQTLAPARFTAIVGSVVVAQGPAVAARTALQSFDFRALAYAQEAFPSLRTVFLFGEGAPAAGVDAPWPRAEDAPPHAVRVAHSGGFEGMAISPDGKTLYPMLEQALAGEPKDSLEIFELDIATQRYTKKRARYRLSPRATSASDFVLMDGTHGLVLERDATEGDPRGWKRLYAIELGADGADVTKTLAVDLMAIDDPAHLAGSGALFQMPFETIESVVFLGGARVAVMNDNNYPFSVGRHRASGRPDDTELVVVDVGRPLIQP